jgi:GNAT superfamily N-acetyltransferase
VITDKEIAAGVHRLGLGDAGELLTLQHAAWVREALSNDTLDIPPLRENLADVVSQLSDPGNTIWGYRNDAGRLIATVRTSLRDPQTALVGRLGVVPDRFREGIGGEMLRFAEKQLPATVTRVELFTGLKSLGNHEFYARHGYVIVERDEVRGIVHLAKEHSLNGAT